MPVQWNEVSSGTMDALPSQVKPPPFPHSNLAVVQQKPAFGQYSGYSPQALQASSGGLDSTQPHPQLRGAPSAPRGSYTHQPRQPATGGQCLSVSAAMSPQANYSQAHPQLSPNLVSGPLNQFSPSCGNMTAKPSHLGLPPQMEVVPNAAMMSGH